MDVYECRDCKHPDNDVDPKTREVIGPIHVAMDIVKAIALSERAGTLPRVFKSPGGYVQFCLICNRMCLEGWDYPEQ